MRQGRVGWILQLDHKGGRQLGEEDHAWQGNQQSNIDFSAVEHRFFTASQMKNLHRRETQLFQILFQGAKARPFLR
jgi:hypothetical protein